MEKMNGIVAFSAFEYCPYYYEKNLIKINA